MWFETQLGGRGYAGWGKPMETPEFDVNLLHISTTTSIFRKSRSKFRHAWSWKTTWLMLLKPAACLRLGCTMGDPWKMKLLGWRLTHQAGSFMDVFVFVQPMAAFVTVATHFMLGGAVAHVFHPTVSRFSLLIFFWKSQLVSHLISWKSKYATRNRGPWPWTIPTGSRLGSKSTGTASLEDGTCAKSRSEKQRMALLLRNDVVRFGGKQRSQALNKRAKLIEDKSPSELQHLNSTSSLVVKNQTAQKDQALVKNCRNSEIFQGIIWIILVFSWTISVNSLDNSDFEIEIFKLPLFVSTYRRPKKSRQMVEPVSRKQEKQQLDSPDP